MQAARDGMSLSVSELYISRNITARQVKYNPISKSGIDPMAFGAYRRWKMAPLKGKGRRKSVKSGRSKIKGRSQNDSRNSQDNNSFYNAIKNLGANPFDRVSISQPYFRKCYSVCAIHNKLINPSRFT